MGRRRGRIYEEVRRVLALYPNNSFLVIIDRSSKTGKTIVPVSRIDKVTKTFIILDDGSMIPLHRIVEVRIGKGREEA